MRFTHRLTLWLAASLLTGLSYASDPLWALKLPDPQGKSQALQQWQGKPVIVNYWATWCGPCRQEMPEMVALQKQYAGKIQFIGIAIDEPQPVAQFAKQLKVNYPILIGGDSAMQLMRQQGNAMGGLPFTVFFDGKGQRVHQHLGKISHAQLEEQIKRLLNAR
ncbi:MULTISPECIES: TlpA family protein disulfide reductase [Chitinibacter]|uniref:TlpA family protein disulfide reductase n=1 Tax=Chitinibacter TaxID=230666 RepID=UPI00041E54BC|nr:MULTISPECIES: TlpA disulfide reductase family protein [Chitinibacter]